MIESVFWGPILTVLQFPGFCGVREFTHLSLKVGSGAASKSDLLLGGIYF